MGEAPPPQKEHILCVMAFKEPTEVLESIRRRHPNAHFKIIRQQFLPNVSWATNQVDVPDGKFPDAM